MSVQSRQKTQVATEQVGPFGPPEFCDHGNPLWCELVGGLFFLGGSVGSATTSVFLGVVVMYSLSFGLVVVLLRLLFFWRRDVRGPSQRPRPVGSWSVGVFWWWPVGPVRYGSGGRDETAPTGRAGGRDKQVTTRDVERL